mmetsp:Transcript_107307/g.308755  ORF Transcript_107307/g.308755 Transcript_107307/m.308755 type:complete len:243 (-) Transcript_107307:6-734(-)
MPAVGLSSSDSPSSVLVSDAKAFNAPPTPGPILRGEAALSSSQRFPVSAAGTNTGAAAVRRVRLAVVGGSQAGASADKLLMAPSVGASVELASDAGVGQSSPMAPSCASRITNSAVRDSPHWQPEKCAAQRRAAASHEKLTVRLKRRLRSMRKPATTSSKSAAWCNIASTIVGFMSLLGNPSRRTSHTTGPGNESPGGGGSAAAAALGASSILFVAAGVIALAPAVRWMTMASPRCGPKGRL